MKRQAKLKGAVRTSKIEFNFLQNDYIIKKFIKKKYNVSDDELSILLYLYPILVFSNNQFLDMLKELDIPPSGKRNNLMSKGFITKYSSDKWVIYYTLTHKAMSMIKRMHRMYLLEEEIPLAYSNNHFARSPKKENVQMVELFRKFNEKVKENTERG